MNKSAGKYFEKGEEQIPPDGWTKVKTENTRSNFKGVLFKNGDEYVEVYLGTYVKSPKDMATNVEMILKSETKQCNDALKFHNINKERNSSKIIYNWVSEENACEECTDLNNTKYSSIDEIPSKLHPNCKCDVEEIKIENSDDDDEDNEDENVDEDSTPGRKKNSYSPFSFLNKILNLKPESYNLGFVQQSQYDSEEKSDECFSTNSNPKYDIFKMSFVQKQDPNISISDGCFSTNPKPIVNFNQFLNQLLPDAGTI